MFTPDYPAYNMLAAEFFVGCKDLGYRQFYDNWPPLWNPEHTLGRPEQAGGDALDVALFQILHDQLITNLSANGSATTTRYQSQRPRSGLVKLLEPVLSAPAPHHGLFTSFALGELNPSQLDPVTETWRRILMYLAPNHDFVAQFRSPNPNNMTTLFHTLLAIQTYSSHAEHFVLSLIQNPRFSFIRLTNTHDTAHAGINFIVTETPQPDPHSRAHTLRDLQRQPVIFDRQGFQIPLPATDPRYITIRSHATSPSYGHWLNSTSRLIRAMIQHGHFPHQLEVDTLLAYRPPLSTDFTLDQAAGTIANLTHALHADSWLTTQIMDALELTWLQSPANLTHFNRYQQDLRHSLRTLLGANFDKLPPSQVDKIITLLSTCAHLFPFDPDELYATVPPNDQRDRVRSAIAIPPRYHAPEVMDTTAQLLERIPLDTKSALTALKKYR